MQNKTRRTPSVTLFALLTKRNPLDVDGGVFVFVFAFVTRCQGAPRRQANVPPLLSRYCLSTLCGNGEFRVHEKPRFLLPITRRGDTPPFKLDLSTQLFGDRFPRWVSVCPAECGRRITDNSARVRV